MFSKMTRKKQAPQKLNSKNEEETRNLSLATVPEESDLPRANGLKPSSEVKSNEEQKDFDSMAKSPVAKANKKDIDSSCQKLLDFTQNFSFTDKTKTICSIKPENEAIWPLNKQAVANVRSPPRRVSDASNSTRNSFSASDSGKHQKSGSGSSDGSPLKSAEELRIRNFENGGKRDRLAQAASLESSDSSKLVASPEADLIKNLALGTDLASLTAVHKHLMDAMRQHKQIYEQCANNWMSVQQRSDNNCLSKSKAERYRWCVQGGESQQKTPRSSSSTQSHVNSLKKSASMAGVGVTPVHDKLYSTVFTGASKFCCRDCGSPFNTLVDLTVHMNKTGHFRDSNIDAEKSSGSKKDIAGSSVLKPKKKLALDDDGQNEKVLTCMGCGNLFESLQDLSVHMIKTKHYENVPSLRMWSQKQTPHPDNSVTPRKKSVTSMGNFRKSEPSQLPPGIDQQGIFRAPFGLPPFMPGITSPAAAAYSSLLYSSPWLASTFPPSILPALYGSSVGFPYPFLYPPGLLPGSFPSQSFPSSDNLEGKLACTKCKESFGSLQKLSEHIQETFHIPDPTQIQAIMGTLASANVSSPNSSDPQCISHSPKSNAGQYGEQNPGFSFPRASRSSGSTTPTSLASKKSNRDYVQTSPEFDGKSPALNFDFIGSLESTIKNAISKVESSRDDKPISPRNPSVNDQAHAAAFGSFFSSLADRPKLDRLLISNKLRMEDAFKSKLSSNLADKKSPDSSGNQHKSSVQSSINAKDVNAVSNGGNAPQFKRNFGKTESPLDLTLKREIAEQLGKEFPQAETKLGSSTKLNFSESSRNSESEKSTKAQHNNKFNVFTSLSQTAQGKTPLQCIHENMQALFSLVKPKHCPDSSLNGTATKSNSPPLAAHSRAIPAHTRTISSPNSYKPIVMSTNASSSSNPLQEMLKIVNSADLRKSRSSAVDHKFLHHQPALKRSSSDSSTPVETKKSKLSTILHDLVIPKEESAALSVNPLQKIQDLVENKLHRTEGKRKHPPAEKISESAGNSYLNSLLATGLSAKNVPEVIGSTSTRELLPSSEINSAFKNGFYTSTSDRHSISSVSNASNSSDAENYRKSSDEDVDVGLEDLELEATFARLFASGAPPSDEEISKHLDLTSNKVSGWFSRIMKEFQLCGQLPFLRYHDKDGQKRVELLCRRCGMLFETADRFSSHVNEHIDARKPKDEQEKCKIKNEPSPTIRGKCTIQGALCIGPYKSFKEVISPPENGIAESVETSKSADSNLTLNPICLHPGKCSDETSSSNDETITVSS